MKTSTTTLPRPAAVSGPAQRGHKGNETASDVPAPGHSQPLTLAKLDAMPAPVVGHATLGDMSVDQLGVAVRGLDRARSQYESLSGTCAILAGLVCIEAKKRSEHGQYLPWLKSHLGKSHTTASQYTAVAKAFIKLQPKLQFAQLTLALMDGAQSMQGESLDMTHPMVSAVAAWTKGRTFYELKQEFTHRPGGKTYERDGEKGKRKTLTAEEATELLKTICTNAAEHLSAVHGDHAYTVLNDAELDGLADHCAQVLEDVKAWRRMTKAERKESLGAALARHLGEGSRNS